MLQNENIVCISNTTWEGFYTKSTVQLLSLLAQQNRVLFVEYPFTVKDLIMTLLGKGRVPVKRMLGLNKRLVKQKSAFETDVYQLIIPPVLPAEFVKIAWLYKGLLKINAAIYVFAVKRALRKLKMQQPVCINAYNSVYGNNTIGRFGEKLHVYYYYDGPDTRRFGERAAIADQKFAGLADGVIVTSDFLANAMKPFNEKTAVVKNGVDFKMFNKKAKLAPNQSKTKKIGYIGSIDHRFDYDTVAYAIQQLPDYEFEFVGDQMNKKVALELEKFPNVKFFPPVKPFEVPELLSKCDVGLIPYLCTEYTKNIYPLKINEYLSVGVPVVLTSFAHLPEFENHAVFTHSKEEFCRAIVTETETDSNLKIKERIRFAESNSWENRAKLFGDIIHEWIKQ